MKRLLAIAAYITFTITTFAVHPDEESAHIIDRLSIVENIDPTTAFLTMETANTDRDALVDDILRYAAQYLGTPYRSGGKGPKAFDCSGFTSYVFRNFGISLSPSSYMQATQGRSVSRDDIRPGDILCFAGRAGGSRVGHVAIAVDIDENGVITFIHASSSGCVKYTKFPDGAYYSRRYLGARRVID